MLKVEGPNWMQRLNGGPSSIGKLIGGGYGTPMSTRTKSWLNTHEYWKETPIAIAALRAPSYLGQDLTRALPNELLREIFCFLCFGSLDRATLASLRFRIPVESRRLLICQISSRWRTVALSTPSLWASIYVPTKPNLPLLKLWLERSGRFPLSLTMEVPANWTFRKVDWPRYSQYFNDAMSLLLTETHRWRHIFFKIDEGQSRIEALANADIASISTLESVSLIFLRNNGEDIKTQLFDVASHLPRLRQIAWKTCRDDPSSFTSPAWSRLTDITLGTPIYTDTLIQLLGLCHSARRVVIKEIDRNYEDDFEWRTNQIVLPFLQSLHLAESKGDMTVVLDHFTMPSLKHLRICTGIQEGGVGRLERFLLRSSSSLDCFVMLAWRMSEESMLIHLQIPAMSNIKRVLFQQLSSTSYASDADRLPQSRVERGEPCCYVFLPEISYMKTGHT